MNIYHITYGPNTGIVQLHFWGCNLACKACLLRREIYDCHLTETKDRIFQKQNIENHVPHEFLDMEAVIQHLDNLTVNEVIFMGAEPALDPELPRLTGILHERFSSYNVLLTNGFNHVNTEHIDEVVFSIKAVTDNIHREFTGKSNEAALKNLADFYNSGVKLRTESIFIPEYIDGSEIEKIARYISSVDKDIPYRIDAYIPIGDNPWRRPTSEEIENAASAARKCLNNVSYLAGTEDLKYEVVRIF